jgi:hypothetical protein
VNESPDVSVFIDEELHAEVLELYHSTEAVLDPE